MARKLVNRKELRKENDAAEAAEGKPVKKSPASEKPCQGRQGSAPQSFLGRLQSVAQAGGVFQYSEKKLADKKAAELTASQKTPHFVQPVKEAIAE